MLGGSYEPADDQVNPQALIEAHGGKFIRDRIESVDAHSRRVRLAGGDELTYDYLSLNLGSRVNVEAIPGAANDPSVWPVKPISNLWKLRDDLEMRFRAGELPIDRRFLESYRRQYGDTQPSIPPLRPSELQSRIAKIP